MINEQNAADLLYQRHRSILASTTFKLLGREWDLLPEVYAPHLTRCAALYAEWISYPRDGSFCEIGCGTGYLATLAALRGCGRVVATDINPAAARNAQMNAQRHNVGSLVHAVCGDMFEPLAGERFDAIFWNSNYVETTQPSDDFDMLTRAFQDPGYQSHDKFLRDAARHLYPNGALLMGFSSMGNLDLLEEISSRYGWKLELDRVAILETADGEVTQKMLRFTRPSAS